MAIWPVANAFWYRPFYVPGSAGPYRPAFASTIPASSRRGVVDLRSGCRGRASVAVVQQFNTLVREELLHEPAVDRKGCPGLAVFR